MALKTFYLKVAQTTIGSSKTAFISTGFGGGAVNRVGLLWGVEFHTETLLVSSTTGAIDSTAHLFRGRVTSGQATMDSRIICAQRFCTQSGPAATTTVYLPLTYVWTAPPDLMIWEQQLTVYYDVNGAGVLSTLHVFAHYMPMEVGQEEYDDIISSNPGW